MQGAILKVFALAGVIGVGCLVVLQAQKSLLPQSGNTAADNALAGNADVEGDNNERTWFGSNTSTDDGNAPDDSSSGNSGNLAATQSPFATVPLGTPAPIGSLNDAWPGRALETTTQPPAADAAHEMSHRASPTMTAEPAQPAMTFNWGEEVVAAEAASIKAPPQSQEPVVAPATLPEWGNFASQPAPMPWDSTTLSLDDSAVAQTEPDTAPPVSPADNSAPAEPFNAFANAVFPTGENANGDAARIPEPLPLEPAPTAATTNSARPGASWLYLTEPSVADSASDATLADDEEVAIPQHSSEPRTAEVLPSPPGRLPGERFAQEPAVAVPDQAGFNQSPEPAPLPEVATDLFPVDVSAEPAAERFTVQPVAGEQDAAETQAAPPTLQWPLLPTPTGANESASPAGQPIGGTETNTPATSASEPLPLPPWNNAPVQLQPETSPQAQPAPPTWDFGTPATESFTPLPGPAANPDAATNGSQTNAVSEPIPLPHVSSSTTTSSPTPSATPSPTPGSNTATGVTSAAAPRGNAMMGSGVVDPQTPSGPQQPELKVEKIAPSAAVVGEPLIYSILVRNVGQSAARDVVIEDQIPRGTELTGTIPRAELVDSRLIWRLGTLEPNQETTIQIRVIPRQTGQVGSVATVRFVAEVAAATTVTEPKLSIQMTSPGEAAVGEQPVLHLTVTNEGGTEARNVIIRTILPPQLNHPGGRDLEYEVGHLAAGATREIDLSLAAEAPGTAQSTSYVTINGTRMSADTAEVVVIPSRLSVTRRGPQQRYVDRPAAFSTSVTNGSAQRPLRNVVVTETLPAGLELAAVPERAQYSAATRTITWQIPMLGPGETQTFLSTVVAQQMGTMESTVRVSDPTGNTAEMTSRLEIGGFPSLAFNVDVAASARAIPVGQQLAVRLVVKNEGSATARRVQPVFELPAQLQFVSAQAVSTGQSVPFEVDADGRHVRFAALSQLPADSEQAFDVILTASGQSDDARIRVQLHSTELDEPLSQEQSVMIFPE